MAMKTSEITLVSRHTVAEIGRKLQNGMVAAKAQSIDDIHDDGSALSRFDERADIEVVAHGSTLMSGLWAVQAYVEDRGDDREITLIALGEGGFARAMNGMRNSASLTTSIKKRDEIASHLG